MHKMIGIPKAFACGAEKAEKARFQHLATATSQFFAFSE